MTSKSICGRLGAATLSRRGLSDRPSRAAGGGPARPALTAAYNAPASDLFRHVSRQAPATSCSRPIRSAPPWRWCCRARAARPSSEMASGAAPAGVAPRASTAANAGVLATLNGYDQSGGRRRPVRPERALAGHLVRGRAVAGRRLPAAGAFATASAASRRRSPPPSARLRVANALMLAQGRPAISSPRTTLRCSRRDYAAEVFRNVALDDVNGWVKRNAPKARSRSCSTSSIPTAPAVILNAVYFKAAWAHAVRRVGDQRRADFKLSAARKVQVPTMQLRGSFAVRRAARLSRDPSALQRRRRCRWWSCCRTRSTALDGVADLLKARCIWASSWRRSRTEPQKQVATSRCRASRRSFRASLASSFRQIGMTQAFDLQAGGFFRHDRTAAGAGAASPSRTSCTAAVIDVTEEGTEAAAATAIAMATTSVPIRRSSPSMVDRPFLFVISDDATGAILFQGRIGDPRWNDHRRRWRVAPAAARGSRAGRCRRRDGERRRRR